ncbi:MAG: hypothetical protein QS2022_3790 [Candidatus Phytoplasma asteris]|uniref:Uncharacterized protein n=1 Tax='Chrysanthemum coronarium' phytoplasma TaxID=1520703 RepID=A0ABQ0J357_9MOLU|nr:MAG: hypothetical protein PLY_3770 [Periwinkle leaf yellowing phytoplasma]WEX19629.1 MAG: hypothetical protein QS2022_3790 [Candidatus Phytoplasma asteris]GAK74034.1 hypothetical protein OYV_05220 ['Chrysanthemum coronarium' phytoplasma]
MWNRINTWLTKLNNGFAAISNCFFNNQNQRLNLVLLTIILLFLPHLLCLIDFLFKSLQYIIQFIYYLGQYIISLFKKGK